MKTVGIVKFFNLEKKWGMIHTMKHGDVFVHWKQILKNGYKSLKKESVVKFDLVETDRGKQAHNVEIVLDD